MRRMLVKVGALTVCVSGIVSGAVALTQAQGLKGKIVIDGSSTVYPITEAAAAAFRKEYPGVDIIVATSGTGGGFKRFVKGETDISDASRPIKAKELQAAVENKVQFIELPIAMDGLSVVVNPKNDWVQQLAVEDLQKIFLSDGSARKWSDLDPKWPAIDIKVYSPGTDSGTFDYFKEVVVPEGKSFRSDMSTSEDDNVLVTGVAGDRGAIGYFGASYYFENKDRLRAVPVLNPELGKAVSPTAENVIDGTYFPLSRPLFIYLKAESAGHPEVRKFVEFYLENSAKFAEQVQYVPVPEDLRKLAKEFFAKRLIGTTFLDAELNARKGGLRAIYKPENLVKGDEKKAP